MLFAMMTNETLKGLDFSFSYFDNVIIFANIKTEHLDHLH